MRELSEASQRLLESQSLTTSPMRSRIYYTLAGMCLACTALACCARVSASASATLGAHLPLRVAEAAYMRESWDEARRWIGELFKMQALLGKTEDRLSGMGHLLLSKVIARSAGSQADSDTSADVSPALVERLANLADADRIFQSCGGILPSDHAALVAKVRTALAPRTRAPTCRVRVQIGELLAALGRFDEAEETLHHALTMYETTVTDSELQQAMVVYRLASVLASLGRWQEAEHWCNESVFRLSECGRDDTPFAARVLQLAADVSATCGHFDEAVAQQQLAVDALQRAVAEPIRSQVRVDELASAKRRLRALREEHASKQRAQQDESTTVDGSGSARGDRHVFDELARHGSLPFTASQQALRAGSFAVVSVPSVQRRASASAGLATVTPPAGTRGAGERSVRGRKPLAPHQLSPSGSPGSHTATNVFRLDDSVAEDAHDGAGDASGDASVLGMDDDPFAV